MTDTLINSTVSGVVSAALLAIPLLIASYRKTKDRKDEMALRKQQWEREDAVAQRVAEAAALLVDSNAKVSANAKEVNGKLDTIHDLVNSNMTAAIEDSMMSKKREVVSLKELIAIKLLSKPPIPPSEEALGIIKATELQIAELQSRLNDRKKQQEVADANKLTVTMTLPSKVE